MAIYKLRDIIKEMVVGKDLPKDNSKIETNEYKYKIIGNGIGPAQVLGYSKTFTVKEGCTSISSRGTIGHVKF